MKHHLLRSIVLAALALVIPAVATAGTVRVTMHDGRVTVVAQNAPLREILTEWARVGQTKIVNAEQVYGPPMTLQLVDVPEREALDTLLRSVSGYIAAPRSQLIANASVYDRLTIMATSHPPAVSAVSAPVPTYQRPPMARDEDDMPVNMIQQAAQQQMELEQQRRAQSPTSPVLMPYPGMQPAPQGQQGPVTSPRPGMPVLTSPTPGALPQPQQPGMPSPYQPSVVRPVGPGGGGGGR